MWDRLPAFEHIEEEFGDLLAALDDAEEAGAMILLTRAIARLTIAVGAGSAFARLLF